MFKLQKYYKFLKILSELANRYLIKLQNKKIFQLLQLCENRQGGFLFLFIFVIHVKLRISLLCLFSRLMKKIQVIDINYCACNKGD